MIFCLPRRGMKPLHQPSVLLRLRGQVFASLKIPIEGIPEKNYFPHHLSMNP